VATLLRAEEQIRGVQVTRRSVFDNWRTSIGAWNTWWRTQHGALEVFKAVCFSLLRSRRPAAWAIAGPRSRAGGDPFALLDRHRAERSVSQGYPSARRNGASL